MLELCDGQFTEVTVFIYEEYYRDLKHILQNYHFSFQLNFISKANKSNQDFIRHFFSYFRKEQFTHIHINTLENNLLLFALKLLFVRRVKLSMTIHSINAFRYNKYSTIKDISESIAKKILQYYIHQYRVLAPEMSSYFESLFPQKKVHFIPGMFYRNILQKSTDDYFLIVVPGTVSEKRRNYDDIVNLFQRIAGQYASSKKIHLVLAGNADSIYGRKIIEKLKETTQTNFKISYFFRYLKQTEYENFYRTADIILAPVQVITRGIRNEEEINGISHSPGFITDQIYIGRPAVIPASLSIPIEFRGCYWRYDSAEELNKIIIEILQNPSQISEKQKLISIACSFFQPVRFQSAFQVMTETNRLDQKDNFTSSRQ